MKFPSKKPRPWLHRAPEPDSNWEYYASRQPHRSPGLVLEIAGQKIALDDLVCAAAEDESRERIDIAIHHPVFPTIEDENLRAQILFIGLDTLLGEDDVERWLGAIEPANEPAEGAFPLTASRATRGRPHDERGSGRSQRDGRRAVRIARHERVHTSVEKPMPAFARCIFT